MEKLERDWFAKGLQDFEYKKYLVLGYLQFVRQKFDNALLYPFFSDLIAHYQGLTEFEQVQSEMRNQFPKRIEKANWENFTFDYAHTEKLSEEMREIEQIVHYAIPRFAKGLAAGKELHEEVAGVIEIEPVGLTPVFFREGYVFVHKSEKNLQIFAYEISIFEQSQEAFRGIHFRPLEEDMLSLSNTYPQIKINLIKKYGLMPNPATFLVRSRKFYPFEETLLPVTKRSLLKFITLLERHK